MSASLFDETSDLILIFQELRLDRNAKRGFKWIAKAVSWLLILIKQLWTMILI